MLKSFAFVCRLSRRRWFYPVLSVMVALSLWIGVPQTTQAVPLRDLIFRGIRGIVPVIQLSNITDEQEVEIGRQINSRLVGRQFRLYQNPQVNEYMEEIGQRLVAESQRPNLPYTFQVVRDDNINAFATAGGYVYVTTGLLKAADNEGQLASVWAHEIGHIESRHLIEQLRREAVQRGIATVAGVDQNTIVNLGVELAINRPRSRNNEFEADQRGLRTLRQAGYAPITMIQFMEKLLDRPSPPNFLSTHPGTQDRIVALERAIAPNAANVGDGLNETDYRANIRPLLQASRS